MRWIQEGRTRSSYVGTLGYRLGKREPAPGFAPPAKSPINERSESVFPMGLPPLADVDPDTPVTIHVHPRGSDWEPAVLRLDRGDLDRDLGERVIAMRRLPNRGFTLHVRATFDNGEPYEGKGRLVIFRGDLVVQDVKFRFEGCEARVGRLVLGADRALLTVDGKRVELPSCPSAAGAIVEMSIVAPRRWTLVVNPVFAGEPRRLSWTCTTGDGGSTRSFTTKRWPHISHGESPGSAKLVFRAAGEKVGEETAELVLGERTVIRPRIAGIPPATGSEAPAQEEPAPAAEARPQPPPLEPGGPGVLVGRCVFPDGVVPPPFPVQLGRFSETGDSAEAPSWWQTATDADGTFSFKGLSPGRYELWARPPERIGRRVRFTIPADGRVELIEITWVENGAIEVHVTGTDGGPIPGQEVGVSPEGVGATRAGVHNARTDETGRAEFTNLRPGRWVVTWLGESKERERPGSTSSASKTPGSPAESRAATPAPP